MDFVLVLLALFLRASGHLQCLCPAGEEGCCTVISELPDCNKDTVNIGNLATCTHSYQRPQLWDIFEMDKNSECGGNYPLLSVFRSDCSASITDLSRLAISAEAYSMSEAYLTVSWAHLHINISEGSTIELRLYRSPYFSCAGHNSRCITEWSCISRYYCTQDLTKTSYTFAGAKFNFVNEVQLAVVTNSEVTTRIRTAFAESAEDFICRSTDGIVSYSIEKCPPPQYGPVTSMRANLTSDGTTMDAFISWEPPVEDKTFRAPLFYHVALYELDSDRLSVGSGSGHLYFAVSPGPLNDGRILIRDLNCSVTYSIKVRVYVNCSACKERSWRNLTLAFIPTPSPPPSPSSTTTEGVPTTTTVLTPRTTVGSPAATVLISTAVVASVILCGCVVVTTLCLVLHRKFLTNCWSERVFCERQPMVENEMTTMRSTTQNYQLNSLTSLSETSPGSDYCFSSIGILPPPSSQQREQSWGPSSTLDECSSEILYRSRYRVLVVYSPYTAQGDIIRSQLVAGLHFEYSELEVICHDIVAMSKKPSCWLIDEVEKKEEGEVHAVLCVWTEEFEKDWRGESRGELDSDLVQALKMVITVSTTHTFKLATILLKPQDKDVLPVQLKGCPTFMMQELNRIAAFVKGIPFYTLE